MLTSKALNSSLLKLKEGGLRVASDPSAKQDRYLLQYGYALGAGTDPTRALSKLQALLVEGDLRQLWHATKQRLKAQLRDAYSAATQPGSSSSRRGAAPVASAELQPLYGSDGVFRSTLMYVLAHASRAFMTRANDTEVVGAQHIAAALSRRAGRPLITVCNHVASMDDPLVMSTILPPDVYQDPSQLRWTLCASDRCFHRELLVPFFRAAKVLPVARGAGMFQPGLAAAEERLRAGDWVHIFPEGTRSRDGAMGPVRKGVGRLVAACGEADPLIVPFVHSGMQRVLPKGSLLPRTSQQVKVLVGEPIDVSDLLAAAAAQRWPDDALYCRIANRIGSRMAALKAQLDGAEQYDAVAAEAAQAAALEAGLDLYDPVDAARARPPLWERAAFVAQHREWAAGGLAAAKARLAAAAASLSRAASGGGGDGAGADAAGGLGGAGRSRLSLVAAALSRRSRGGSSDDYSYQRSVAMMQLLQARV